MPSRKQIVILNRLLTHRTEASQEQQQVSGIREAIIVQIRRTFIWLVEGRSLTDAAIIVLIIDGILVVIITRGAGVNVRVKHGTV